MEKELGNLKGEEAKAPSMTLLIVKDIPDHGGQGLGAELDDF